MAKDKNIAAQHTPELPGLPVLKRRGRPVTGKAKTLAERQAIYRERRAAEFSEWLQAVYRAGFDDAAAGRPPAPADTWQNKDAAIAYVCGGLDANSPHI